MAKKDALCNTCTLKMVSIAYQRYPFFRLIREPLKLGMRMFSWWYDVNKDDYAVRTPTCYGCIRFYKTALKERSRLFRWLNDLINPLFDSIIERIVTEDEISKSKSYASSASSGRVTSEEFSEWMKGLKRGF